MTLNTFSVCLFILVCVGKGMFVGVRYHLLFEARTLFLFPNAVHSRLAGPQASQLTVLPPFVGGVLGLQMLVQQQLEVSMDSRVELRESRYTTSTLTC